MTNCLIAQSGGPTAVINASLSGIITAALESDEIGNVYGALHGIEGVLNSDLILLNPLFATKDSIEQLRWTPAMYLGSCRFKLKPMENDESQYEKIIQVLDSLDINYFFYIGGNDSMDTVLQLSRYAAKHQLPHRFIGIPKTIDNDLCGIDHTPGFGSAAKYVATSILEIAHDSYIYDLDSVTIVEIMGRNAGWLTAASCLARTAYSQAPDLIYCPEVPFDKEQFIRKTQELIQQKRNVIVAVSEGIKNTNGEYVSAEKNSDTDLFGHAKLSGSGRYLESLVKHTIGCKVRTVELNVLQRSALHCGSLTDNTEAFNLGKNGVAYALANFTGQMVALNRVSHISDYQVEYSLTPIEQVANHEKSIPIEWLTPDGDDVTQELVEYMLPLIQGESQISYKNGVPEYIPIIHLAKNK